MEILELPKCEYYLHLDCKEFWMLNITRVIDIFSPRMTLGKRLKLREELACSMITRSENATLKNSNNKNDSLSWLQETRVSGYCSSTCDL